MLLVPTQLGLSAIHGIGLFSSATIAAGTVVWEFTPGFDLVFDPDQILALPPVAKMHVQKIAYLSQACGRYVYCVDGAGYFNHSEQPNVRCVKKPDSRHTGSDGIEEPLCIADREIPPGVEMTVDYREFDADPSDIYPIASLPRKPFK